jgi:spore maturation protein CgeB
LHFISKIMKILYAGELSSVEINCFLRMRTLQKMGYAVIPFDFYQYQAKGLEGKIQFHFGWGRNVDKLNHDFIQVALQQKPDLIWVDKGLYIKASTLQFIKKNLNTKISHLVPDDPFGYNRKGWGIFYNAIPYYDLHFVKRPYNIPEYKQLGATKVFEYDHSFDPLVHKPMILTQEEYKKYHANVGFIGTCETHRANTILYLIENGIAVSIWGKYWNRYKHWNKLKPFYRGGEIHGEEYAKVLSGIDIALHFLRKANRDAQDSRTFEIPACGAFMLAEKTYKHEQFFKADEEAVFFENNQELLQKVIYYQKNDVERKKIAENGYLRCLKSGYDHESRLNAMLELVKKELFNATLVLENTKHNY